MLKKILYIVLDGLGDRPHPVLANKTPLEAAIIPNMNRLAEAGQQGLAYTVYSEYSVWAVWGHITYFFFFLLGFWGLKILLVIFSRFSRNPSWPKGLPTRACFLKSFIS